MKKIQIIITAVCIIMSSTIVAQETETLKTDNSMEEKSIMIATAIPNPNETESMKYYSENSKKLLTEAGGIPIGKYNILETIEGKNSPTIVLIVEFPNRKAINDYLESTAYKKLIPYRKKAFLEMNIYITK